VLGAHDPLPAQPRRVLVAGTSGSGKTTLAQQVADVLGVPHVEIDGLFHGPGWTPREEFVPDVQRFTDEPAWVTEWQYDAVRPLLAERADLLVWLDLPRRTVLRQVVVRTWRRRRHGTVLWHGNVEPPLRTFFTDPGHVVRWAWRTHASTAQRVAGVRPDLPVVRLRSHAEAAAWLDRLRQARYGGS
jgi:adenylate kinase family enzyme